MSKISHTTSEPRSNADVQAAWTGASTARNYAGARWSTARRKLRDAQRLQALIRSHAPADVAHARWLDVACGTGRLAAAWQCESERYVGIDASPAMLGQHSLGGRVAQASALALPFADDSFELVIACRFLHHLVERADLERAAQELTRVSSSHIAATFWDAHSLADWRNPKRGGNARDPRIARTRGEFSAAFEHAGARLVAYSHSFRFISRQSYALFAVNPGA